MIHRDETYKKHCKFDDFLNAKTRESTIKAAMVSDFKDNARSMI